MLTNSASTAAATDRPGSPSALDTALGKVGKVRWTICALVFFATTINYIDRQTISILKPIFDKEFHWTQTDYANIQNAFTAAYSVGQLCVGFWLDRIGVRRGFAIAVGLWSIAAIVHGFVHYLPMNSAFAHSDFVLRCGGLSVLAFGFVRMLLGISESANFPAGIKTIAIWFPRRERGTATGFMNAGSNVGALVTPLIAPLVALSLGWPVAFYITGSLGFLWLIGWLWLYREPTDHPTLAPEEKAYILSDGPDIVGKVPPLQVISKPQTWAFTLGKFLTDPVWWFYLFWGADFLNKKFHLDLKHFGLPLVVIYLMADVGSIGGGWLSGFLMDKGWSVNAARKTTMLVCACCVVPVLSAPHTSSMWVAVFLIGLAASAHQGFSSNLFTLTSDTAPRSAVGSVMGFGGMAGGIGVMLFQAFVGRWLDHTHNNYTLIFAIASGAYLVALLIIHLLMPRLEPMRFPGVPTGDEFTTEDRP
jgi:ACS family hexuronate transporter-like MFS transporter